MHSYSICDLASYMKDYSMNTAKWNNAGLHGIRSSWLDSPFKYTFGNNVWCGGVQCMRAFSLFSDTWMSAVPTHFMLPSDSVYLALYLNTNTMHNKIKNYPTIDWLYHPIIKNPAAAAQSPSSPSLVCSHNGAVMVHWNYLKSWLTQLLQTGLQPSDREWGNEQTSYILLRPGWRW